MTPEQRGQARLVKYLENNPDIRQRFIDDCQLTNLHKRDGTVSKYYELCVKMSEERLVRNKQFFTALAKPH